jgi:hypothetical protein
MRKRNGDRTQPCGTPAWKENDEETRSDMDKKKERLERNA